MKLAIPHSKRATSRMNNYHLVNNLQSRRISDVIIIIYQRLCIFYQRRRRFAAISTFLFFLSFLFLSTRQFHQYLPLPFAFASSRIRISTNNNQQTAPILYPFPPSRQTLQQLNDYLKPLSLRERLQYWLFEQPHPVVSVTSLGATGMVLIDALAQANLLPLVTVITIDTLHLFPETYQFYQTVQQQYPDLDLRVYQPRDLTTKQAFDAHFGADLYRTDPEQYAYHSKVEPLQRALEELNAKVWFTGRRRDQGGERSQLSLVELDEDRLLKVNPMADWTYSQVWDYLHQHHVPYNPLHDRGYKSIGDTMTTRAVASTAAERSGRFVGLNQTECGMHHHLEKLHQLKQEAAEQNVAFELPKLVCKECDYEVTANTFWDVVGNAPNVLLMEFYSPLCGACQDFAPTFEQVVHSMKSDSSTRRQVQVARYDITVDPPTDAMEEAGFEVEVTPTLYLVVPHRKKPILFQGELASTEILRWIHNNYLE